VRRVPRAHQEAGAGRLREKLNGIEAERKAAFQELERIENAIVTIHGRRPGVKKAAPGSPKGTGVNKTS